MREFDLGEEDAHEGESKARVVRRSRSKAEEMAGRDALKSILARLPCPNLLEEKNYEVLSNLIRQITFSGDSVTYVSIFIIHSFLLGI